VGGITAQSRAVTARARSARPKWESIPVFLNLNRRWLRVAHGRARKLSGVWTQIEDLGGRLSDSGSRSGHIRDGAHATRVISGENGASCTGSGNPAAQQAAQTDEQQPPVQLRSDAGSIPDCFHCDCCNDAADDERSDCCDAAWF
jgi:hypothetical protein